MQDVPGEGLRLSGSENHDDSWPTSGWYEAEPKSKYGTAAAPGVYAYVGAAAREMAIRYMGFVRPLSDGFRLWVLGEVALQALAPCRYECEDAPATCIVRAERGRPLSLHVPALECDELAEWTLDRVVADLRSYGVPVAPAVVEPPHVLSLPHRRVDVEWVS